MNTKTDEENNVIPDWQISGDWFDICSCNAPCPCTMAQSPTSEPCEGVFAYRIKQGHYGEHDMAGLKVAMLFNLYGNAWDGGSADVGIFFDAAANEGQRDALQMIFTGQAGGWMSQFVPALVREVKGVEFANITVGIDDNLEHWNIEIPDAVNASGEALTGPTADPDKRVQTYNAPGSEVGPTDGPVTWGKSITCKSQALGFSHDIPAGQNSKHIPFDWSGPDK